jgi:hypothetical protein
LPTHEQVLSDPWMFRFGIRNSESCTPIPNVEFGHPARGFQTIRRRIHRRRWPLQGRGRAGPGRGRGFTVCPPGRLRARALGNR